MSLPTSAIQSKQQFTLGFIDEYVRRTPGEDKEYQTNVVIEVVKSGTLFRKEKTEVQTRVMVVGTYRLYIFSPGKEIRKKVVEIRLPDVVEIDSDGKRMTIKWQPPDEQYQDIVSMRTDKLSEIVKVMCQKRQSTLFSWPPLPFTSAPQIENWENFVPESPATPFINAYLAWCNYHNVTPSYSFMQFVRNIEARNSYDLDLRQCPGIEPVGAVMLNVLPIFTALRHDQHFKSVIISGVSRKDIVHLLADALKTNSTLTKIAVVETEGDSTAFSCLAAALRDNQSIALQQIDLSGHLSFGNKPFVDLARALSAFPVRITHLKLSDCGLSGKAIGQLFAAFQMNYRVSCGIQHLNLSGNKFDQSAATQCQQWAEKAKEAATLKSLCLASTNVPIGCLVPLRQFRELESIDLGDNKIESAADAKQLCMAFDASTSINSIDVSKCSIAKFEYIEAIVSTAMNRLHASAVSLNISYNPFYQMSKDEFVRFQKLFSNAPKLASLDLSGLNFKESLLGDLLQTLKNCSNLRTLKMNGIGRTANADVLASLVTFPSLQALSLANSFTPEIHQHLLSLIRTQNRTITDIDISHNGLSDDVASIIGQVLVSNTVIKKLKCEGNQFSISGWQAILEGLRASASLTRLSNPILDLFIHRGLNGDQRLGVTAEYVTRRMAGIAAEMQVLSKAIPELQWGEKPYTLASVTPLKHLPLVDVPESLTSVANNSHMEEYVDDAVSPTLHRQASTSSLSGSPRSYSVANAGAPMAGTISPVAPRAISVSSVPPPPSGSAPLPIGLPPSSNTPPPLGSVPPPTTMPPPPMSSPSFLVGTPPMVRSTSASAFAGAARAPASPVLMRAPSVSSLSTNHPSASTPPPNARPPPPSGNSPMSSPRPTNLQPNTIPNMVSVPPPNFIPSLPPAAVPKYTPHPATVPTFPPSAFPPTVTPPPNTIPPLLQTELPSPPAFGFEFDEPPPPSYAAGPPPTTFPRPPMARPNQGYHHAVPAAGY